MTSSDTNDEVRHQRAGSARSRRRRGAAQRVARAAFSALSLGAVLGAAVSEAAATGSAGSEPHDPIEVRVGLAIGPSRTTSWTQLWLDSEGGSVALIVPVRVGASLDWASDGFMSALEAATAPRIGPPVDEPEYFCPELGPPADPFHVAGELTPMPPLPEATVVVLDTAAAVADWAGGFGITLSGSLSASLAELTGHRFVATRFTAPIGEMLTPTLRVSGPDVAPTLPLLLVEGGDRDVRVTTWVLGEGRASIDDGAGIELGTMTLTYDAVTGATDYREKRRTALATLGASSWLVESASHRALGTPLTLEEGHVLSPLSSEYALRAAVTGGFDGASCAAQLAPVVAATARVAPSCPRASLGVVEGTPSCTEVVGTDEIDPAALRCGAIGDDLAVAFSELTPAATWLTRISMRVAAHGFGATRTVTLSTGSELEPVTRATHVDRTGCAGAGGTGAGGAGGGGGAAGPGGGSGRHVAVPVFFVDRGCGSTEIGAQAGTEEIFVDESEEGPDAIWVEEDCSGDTTESYAVSYTEDGASGASDDGCSGDTTTAYETYETYETVESEPEEPSEGAESGGEDCGGDTTETRDGASDGEGCSGDTSESYETYETTESYETSEGDDDDSESSSASSEGCGSDTSESQDDSDDGCSSDTSSSSDDGCSGDTAESAAQAATSPRGKRTRRGSRIRLSKVSMGLAFILLPLRRLTRRRRDPLRLG